MRIGLLILLAFLSACFCDAQVVNEVDHYKTKDFDAAIFPKEIIVCSDTVLNRFTPTRGEVDSAERIIRIEVGGSKAATKPHPRVRTGDSGYEYLINTDTTIFSNEDLHRWFSEHSGYFKQYFGCIDKNGDKILLVSCFILPEEFWLQEPITGEGPYYDAHYWKIKYNLATGKLFDPVLGSTFFTKQLPLKGIDHYQTKDFNLAIFSKAVAKLDDTILARFTPTREEVYTAEMALQAQIKKSSTDSIWSQDKDYGVFSDPHIHKHDSDYRRQYFGYIDKNGDKILLINSFSWEGFGGSYNHWLKEPITTEYSGSYAWNIRYNMNTGKFFDSVWGRSIISRNMYGVDHYRTDNFDVGIFPADKDGFDFTGDQKRHKTFTPVRAQIDSTEKAFKYAYSKQKDLSLGVRLGNLINKGSYVKQYFGYIDEKKDSILYINCGCIYYHGTPPGYLDNWNFSWINRLQRVSDGGDCYWNIKFNLQSKHFFDLNINDAE